MSKAYTVAKVAQKLHCHPNTVKRIEKRLKLNVKRDYRNYRVYNEDLIKQIMDYMNTEIDPSKNLKQS